MNGLDRWIIAADKVLRVLAVPATTVRPMPGESFPESALDEHERRHAAALMRINHSGEICAQALYQGQAMTSRTESIRYELGKAAREEEEHLAWTERRIFELGGRKSWLNPFWYGGALAMGALAGCCGDRWNLGFLAETERQVGAHLEDHLHRLPRADQKSRELVTMMRDDELSHAATAVRLGAADLPVPVKWAMKRVARVMTAVTYRF